MFTKKSTAFRFYCVTKNRALYRVTVMEKKNLVSLAKLAQKGKPRTDIQVGEVHEGFDLFIGGRLLLNSEVADGEIGQRSPSLTVALFLKKSDALACFNARNLKPCDLRWEEETISTLLRAKKFSQCRISPNVPWQLMPSPELEKM